METVTIISIDNQINTALETQNVTRTVLDGLKQYNKLAIAGIDDKTGYEAVDKARKQCKAIRVMAEKICKAGREEAIKTQKAWIGKEKEIVGEIEETESYLQEQQDKIDNEKQRIEDEKREAERLRIQNRIDKLTAVGYALDFAVVSTISDEQFEQTLTEATELHNAELAKQAEEKFLADWDEALVENQRLNNEAESKRLQKISDDQKAEQKKIDDARDELERKQKQAEMDALQNARLEKLMPVTNNRTQSGSVNMARLWEMTEQDFETVLKNRTEKFNNLKIEDEKAAELAKENAERERLRLEALKPEKEKLKTWVNSNAMPVANTEGMKPETIAIADSIFAKFQAFNKWANEQIDSIA